MDKCPSGQYGVGAECLNCSTECKECSGPSGHECTDCKMTHILVRGECIYAEDAAIIVAKASKFTSVYNLTLMTEQLVQLNHRMDTSELILTVAEGLKGSCQEVVNGSDGILCLGNAKDVVGMAKIEEKGIEDCVSVIESIAQNEEIAYVDGVLEGAIEAIDAVFELEGSERKKNYEYGSRLYSSFQRMVEKFENDVVFEKNAEGGYNTEAKEYQKQTDIIDFSLKKGCVQDGNFSLEASFDKHSWERFNYYSTNRRQLEPQEGLC